MATDGSKELDGWMSLPTVTPLNCPPGLEYLTSIDQFLVRQKPDLFEAFVGFEKKNKFVVQNSLDQKIFYAIEESEGCTRVCCGTWRPFEMTILDRSQTEVIHLNRQLACDSCLWPCCLQSIDVYSPPGSLVGTVQQEWSILTPVFAVNNAADDTIFRIVGPCCTFSMCGDVDFNVFSLNSSLMVGKISKNWSGLIPGAFTDTDNFGINFPVDLDVRMKAVMLGACFLIVSHVFTSVFVYRGCGVLCLNFQDFSGTSCADEQNNKNDVFYHNF